MTKKLKDIVATVGEYQTRDGETKKRWQNVGALMESDDGNQFILLERWFNPAGLPNPQGRNSVLLSLFSNERQQSKSGQSYQDAKDGAKESEPEFDDDIPF